ncbi:hypothetical protein D9758_014443 [Tetrapyrgos nigripes]|uniref:Zn(2)-C6 fungal-type domain-containing protein n=1 Tax=Tetrapyrgos nigripes TaxID=182062 RepID=A0A8H5FB16_9AGAR|nr:hypothetical protein D9758_014443 [Tetrapyrgos nigripes]
MLVHSSPRNKSDIQDASHYPIYSQQPMNQPRPFSYRDTHFDQYPYEDQNAQGVRLPYSNSRQYPSPISDGSQAGLSPVSTPVYDQGQYPSSYAASQSYTTSGYSLETAYDLSGPIPSVSQLRRREFPSSVDTSIASSANYQPPNSAATISSNEGWSPNGRQPSPTISEPQKRKTRREKPKIPLALNQPFTTQGKPRARVYVACLQCRTRKIRCDGAKPVCHNCGRRSNGNNECTYDTVPRRRGPDKTPGARQRMARDMRGDLERSRRRRRPRSPENEISKASGYSNVPVPNHRHTRSGSESNHHGSLSPASSSDYLSTPCVPMQEPLFLNGPSCVCHGTPVCPDSSTQLYPTSKRLVTNTLQYEHDVALNLPVGGMVTGGYITAVDDNEQNSEERADVSREPSLNFSRKTWFDSLLALYSGARDPHRMSNHDRELAQTNITADLRFLFRVSNYWFSFFHIPTFFGTYFDTEKRERMQPSLILATLAVSTFWKSSDIGLGHDGRQRALRFRDEAQSALEASFNAGFVDETLAQAAWLLALFEVCSHPDHSTTRSVSSMRMLDSIIRSLSLTFVDADNPQASVFPPGTVPAVQRGSPRQSWPIESTVHEGNPYPASAYSVPPTSPTLTNGCSCLSLTLGQLWPTSLEHTPMWAPTPAWDESWTEADIRRESCRRLCWSAISLAAGHVSYAMASHSHGLDLFIADPANFSLLFSGESIVRSPSLAGSKDTVWALYDRSFLLWHFCVRMRNNHSATDDEKAQFAVRAWLETEEIEQALNKHTCDIERSFIFQGREYLFNTRMCITYEYQRYIPLVPNNVPGLFHRKKAEEWLTHQGEVARRFMHGLHTITGNTKNDLLHRPFFVLWWMSQISRALSLWQCDNSMTIALDVCKAFLPAVNYLSSLWPCPEQRHRYRRLCERLTEACIAANIAPPPAPSFTLSLSQSPQTY